MSLNVGGVTHGFTVSKHLLCSVKGSALEAMFSGRHALPLYEGKVFVDRDPQVFNLLINYLRNNLKVPTQLDKLTSE